jgi:zinc protease
VERATAAAFQIEQPGPKAEPAPLPAPETACAKPERVTLQSVYPGGFLGIAFPAPSVKDDPDVYAMDLLLTLLEHGETGRLPRLLRNIAGVEATFETRRQPGLFTVVAATGNNNPEQVEAALRKELGILSTQAVPEAELTFAKRALRGDYALDNEPYSGQGSTLGYYEAIDSWKFAANYLARVESITAEQLQAVARKYIDLDHSATVILQPRNGPMPPRGNPGT